MLDKPPMPKLTLTLFLASVVASFGWAIFLFYHPVKPAVSEKPVIVEKLVPCPTPLPTRTGPATQSGDGGIAHSGNGDTYTISPKPQTVPPKHK